MKIKVSEKMRQRKKKKRKRKKREKEKNLTDLSKNYLFFVEQRGFLWPFKRDRFTVSPVHLVPLKGAHRERGGIHICYRRLR